MKANKCTALFSLTMPFLLAACAGPQPSSSTTDNKPQISAAPSSGHHIYVTNEKSGDLSVIDSATNEVVATVPLGKRPRGIHVSPDHQTIYIALSGTPIAGPGVDQSKLPPSDKKADGIGVFDVRQNKLTSVIQGGSDPEEFDLSKDGKLLFASNEDAGLMSIVDIGTAKVAQSVKVGEEPEGVKTSPDGKFVYVTSEDSGTISVIDPAAAKLITMFEVGHRPRKIAFLPDGSKAFVTLENDGAIRIVDSVQHKPLGTINVGKPGEIKPMAVIVSADGSTAYVSTGRGKKVFFINTKTGEVTGSVEAGDRPWGIGLSPDGKTLYTANGPSNDVSVIDLATQTVTKKIKVGDGPWGIVVF
jgi:YVTN family beta-propeller protein